MKKTYIRGGFVFLGVILFLGLLIAAFDLKLNFCIPDTSMCFSFLEIFFNFIAPVIEIPLGIIKYFSKVVFSNNRTIASISNVLLVVLFYFNIGGLLGILLSKIRGFFDDYQWVKFKKVLVFLVVGLLLISLLCALILFYVLVPRGVVSFYSGGSPWVQEEYNTSCSGKNILLNNKEVQGDGDAKYLCIGSLKSELNPYYQKNMNNTYYSY